LPKTRDLAGDTAARATLFAALGDETRLRLIARLSAGEPLSISRLAAEEPATRQAITRHLEVLEGAGLVRGERQGRERVWELDPERFTDAEEALAQIREQWDRALNRLRAFVED
jgi:DNA-binding transcriptional ArsR family regulator